MRKVVYLVRHGESESNAGPILKGFDAQLTEKGRQQAHQIAERCKKLTFDIVISSTMPRALDTARAISDATGVAIEASELFWERRRPSSMLGMLKDSADAARINERVWENFLIPGARIADEENFEDLRARAVEALHLLESRPEDRILVAGHGIFARIMLAVAVLGTEIGGKEALAFVRAFRTKNTGVTVLIHGDVGAHTPWEVLTWNDHAHLG